MDNIKEFKSIKSNTFYNTKGLFLKYNITYTQAQNNKIKRFNLYLLKYIISIYSYKNIPLKL